jgi:hypothetical protein
MTSIKFSPVIGLVQTVHTVAIGISSIECSSLEYPKIFTLLLVYSKAWKLAPATQVSACESNSQRAIPSEGMDLSNDKVDTAQMIQDGRRQIQFKDKTSVLMLLDSTPPNRQVSPSSSVCFVRTILYSYPSSLSARESTLLSLLPGVGG